MAHSALRSSLLMWYSRLAQSVVAIVILALAVANVTDWHGIECAIPRQLQINVSAAALTLPLVFYLVSATGPSRLASLPWSAPFQLILDLFLLCYWLVPSTFASYGCSEVCPSCTSPLNKGLTTSLPSNDGFFVWVGRLTCSCYVPRMSGANVMKRVAVTMTRNAYLRPGNGHATTKIFKGTSRIAAKRGMDWVMVVLLASTFLLTAVGMFRRRRSSSRRGSNRLVEYMDTKSPTDTEKKSDVNVSVIASPYSSSPGSPRSPPTPASFLSP